MKPLKGALSRVLSAACEACLSGSLSGVGQEEVEERRTKELTSSSVAALCHSLHVSSHSSHSIPTWASIREGRARARQQFLQQRGACTMPSLLRKSHMYVLTTHSTPVCSGTSRSGAHEALRRGAEHTKRYHAREPMITRRGYVRSAKRPGGKGQRNRKRSHPSDRKSVV